VRIVRFACERHIPCLPLVLAGILLLPFNLTGQTTPASAQGGAAASAQLPAEAQAQSDKLEDALMAAHAAADTKTEAKTLNQIGAVYLLGNNRFDADGVRVAPDGWR